VKLKEKYKKLLKIEEKRQKVELKKDSGKIKVSFRPMFKKTPYENYFDVKFHKKAKPDKKGFSYYDPNQKNAIVIDLHLYDDQYEDEHHIRASFTLNFKIITGKNKVLFPIKKNF
jgi:hypothetical protein